MRYVILIGIILLGLTACDAWKTERQSKVGNLKVTEIPNETEVISYDSLTLYATDMESIDSLIRYRETERVVKELVYCTILSSLVDHPHDYLESSDFDNQYRLWTIAVVLEYLLIDHPTCTDNFSIRATFLSLFAEVNTARVEMQLIDPEKYASSIYITHLIINTFNNGTR